MRRFALLALAVAVVAAIGLNTASASVGAPHSLKPGQRVVFKPGALKVGSTVGCTSHGIHVAEQVPRRGRSSVGIADGVNGGSATLRLTTQANGSVVAVCR